MTGEMNREGLLTLCKYNTYATNRLLTTAEKLGQEQLDQEISPSHRTVLQLLQHMMASETYFLAVCQGHTLDFDPARYSTLEEMRAYWDGLEHRMQRYIETSEEAELERSRTFQLGDEAHTLPTWKLLLQALVHAMHHRGELSILLSQLGHPLPNMDIILYFLEEGSKPEK